MKKNFTLLILVLFLLTSFDHFLLSQTFDNITDEDLSVMSSDSMKMQLLSAIAWKIKAKEADRALRYVQEGLEIADRLKLPKGKANLTHDIGMMYWYKSDYENASAYFFEALALREALGDKQGLGGSYNDIGNVFFKQKNYTKAYEYYLLGLNMRIELKDSSGLIYSYSNVGDVLLQEKKYSKALKNYRLALKIANTTQHKPGKAFVLQNFGLLYKETIQRDSAMYYFEQAYLLTEEIEDKNNASANLNQIALLNLERKEYKRALAHAGASRIKSKESNAKENLKEACGVLSKAYAGLGEYEKAYLEMQEYTRLNNELLDASRVKAMIESASKYQAVKNETEILSQKTNILEQEKELGRLTIFIIVLSLIVLLVVGIGVFIRYRNNLKNNKVLNQKNAQIATQNENLVRSNSALEQFAYVASHDLKEPLRNISSFSSLLERNYKDKLDDEAKEYIGFITGGVSHMNILLEDVLAYSRLTQNTLTRNENINLNKTLAKVKVTLAKVIKEKNVVITSDELPIIQSNNIQMYQLLQNLISNGIKFNTKTNPTIHIAYNRENGMHKFSVEDNGIGINKDYGDKIFQVFQRLHKKDEFAGTGIGLAICKKIVDQHGGKIWFESSLNVGTSFHFNLESTGI